MSVASNLKIIQEKIDQAILSTGGSNQSVTIMAVTKTKPIQVVQDVVAAGLLDIGENYVQEVLEKQNHLADLPIRWHFIGSLQSKKISQLWGRFHLIHTVDREKVVKKMGALAQQSQVIQPILMQVNVGDEASKSGVSLGEASDLMGLILETPGLEPRGLMTMPPLSEIETEARSYFSTLAKLRDKLSAEYGLSPKNGPQLSELSMGTSHDYVWAIKEGATIVRLGTVLVGARSYP